MQRDIGRDVLLPPLFSSSSLHHAGCAALFLLLWQRGIIHLSNNLCKQLVHHSLALGRSFNKGAAPFLSQGSSVRPGDFALRFQVDLVPDKDEWHLLKAFHSHNLISHWSDILRDTEDKNLLYHWLFVHIDVFFADTRLEKKKVTVENRLYKKVNFLEALKLNR